MPALKIRVLPTVPEVNVVIIPALPKLRVPMVLLPFRLMVKLAAEADVRFTTSPIALGKPVLGFQFSGSSQLAVPLVGTNV